MTFTRTQNFLQIKKIKLMLNHLKITYYYGYYVFKLKVISARIIMLQKNKLKEEEEYIYAHSTISDFLYDKMRNHCQNAALNAYITVKGE